MNDSYFKTATTFHFFDKEILSSVRRAYDGAKAVSHRVSVYRVPAMSGPWDKCGVIGHRARNAVLMDLSIESNEEEVAKLHAELDAIGRQFLAVGRLLPMQSVAA